MKPTLLVGDYLFVSKFAYGYSRYSLPLGLPLFSGRILERLPERGDVVVFKLPSDNKTDYIKRVVGLPGDRIQVRDGLLYINDEPVQVTPAGSSTRIIDGRAVRGADARASSCPTGREHLILDLTSTGSLDNTGVYVVPPDHVFAMGDNRDNSLDSRVENVGFIPVREPDRPRRAAVLLGQRRGQASGSPGLGPWASATAACSTSSTSGRVPRAAPQQAPPAATGASSRRRSAIAFATRACSRRR